jgi:hypothetical protein
MVTVTTAIAAVLAFSALLGWILLRASTSIERARRDRRYRFRYLLLHGAMSAGGAVACCVLVAAMRPPVSQAVPCIVMGLLNLVAFINLARMLRAPRV